MAGSVTLFHVTWQRYTAAYKPSAKFASSLKWRYFLINKNSSTFQLQWIIITNFPLQLPSFVVRHQWEAVTLALFQKYPNPFTTHVLCTDVLSRWLDQQGRLHSLRLLLKSGGSAVPNWIQSFIRSRESYVLEESIVDPLQGLMTTRTINLSHRKYMTVEEIQSYLRQPNDEWYLYFVD